MNFFIDHICQLPKVMSLGIPIATKEQNTVKPVLRGHLWDKEKVVF
jgi:hypothetical protein